MAAPAANPFDVAASLMLYATHREANKFRDEGVGKRELALACAYIGAAVPFKVHYVVRPKLPYGPPTAEDISRGFWMILSSEDDCDLFESLIDSFMGAKRVELDLQLSDEDRESLGLANPENNIIAYLDAMDLQGIERFHKTISERLETFLRLNPATRKLRTAERQYKGDRPATTAGQVTNTWTLAAPIAVPASSRTHIIARAEFAHVPGLPFRKGDRVFYLADGPPNAVPTGPTNIPASDWYSEVHAVTRASVERFEVSTTICVGIRQPAYLSTNGDLAIGILGDVPPQSFQAHRQAWARNLVEQYQAARSGLAEEFRLSAEEKQAFLDDIIANWQ